jgi:hypothetical protein
MSLGGQCILQKKLLTANGAMATLQFLLRKWKIFASVVIAGFGHTGLLLLKRLKGKGPGEASLKYGGPVYLHRQVQAFYSR